MVEILAWFQSKIQSLRDSSDLGAAAVEYGLLVGLIAVVIILTVTALGGKLNDMFNAVCEALPVVGSC
ncbi:MAG: Flp family type IVb pilin [Actinomycetota bacterium]